jgi:hypothetical protein
MNKLFLALVILCFVSGCRFSGDESLTIRLDNEKWLFHEGDSSKYAQPNLNDIGWLPVQTKHTNHKVSLFEYQGRSWYRVKVRIPSTFKKTGFKKLGFYFGLIGDCDSFYLNGHLIGSNNIISDTTFASMGAYRDVARKYEVAITSDLIKWDEENLIAIRVFNSVSSDKIISKCYIKPSGLELEHKYKFDNNWFFIKGDDTGFAGKTIEKSNALNLRPGREWEAQAAPDYDGFAWYRTTIDLPLELKNRKTPKIATMRLVLGEIDDNDQVFLNGQLIAENGSTLKPGTKVTNAFKKRSTLAGVLRVYDLDVDDPRINWGAQNVLAIRVFDSGGNGGIFEEPYYTFLGNENNIRVDLSKLYQVNGKNKLDTVALLYNNSFKKFSGIVKYKAFSETGRDIVEKDRKITINPRDSLIVPISLPFTKSRLKLNFLVDDKFQSNIYCNEIELPFVLYK